MNLASILILLVVAISSILIVYFKIKRIKEGKGFCSCGCDNCPNKCKKKEDI